MGSSGGRNAKGALICTVVLRHVTLEVFGGVESENFILLRTLLEKEGRVIRTWNCLEIDHEG